MTECALAAASALRAHRIRATANSVTQKCVDTTMRTDAKETGVTELKLTTRKVYFVDKNPAHAQISVWQNGGLAGVLTVEEPYVGEVIDRITGKHIAELEREMGRLREALNYVTNQRDGHQQNYLKSMGRELRLRRVVDAADVLDRALQYAAGELPESVMRQAIELNKALCAAGLRDLDSEEQPRRCIHCGSTEDVDEDSICIGGYCKEDSEEQPRPILRYECTGKGDISEVDHNEEQPQPQPGEQYQCPHCQVIHPRRPSFIPLNSSRVDTEKLQALLADRERLDWLEKDHACTDGNDNWWIEVPWPNVRYGMTIREAIDAAREGSDDTDK